MPITNNTMALASAQQDYTDAIIKRGHYEAVEKVMNIGGKDSLGNRCLSMLSNDIENGVKFKQSDKLLACLICNRFAQAKANAGDKTYDPAMFPLPAGLTWTVMNDAASALSSVVMKIAEGFNAKQDSTDTLTQDGAARSFVARNIEPVINLFSDINEKVPGFDDENHNYSRIAAWYVLGYKFYLNSQGGKTKDLARNIADVFDNYISTGTVTYDKSEYSAELVPLDKINTNTQLAPVTITKLIMKVDGLDFISAIKSRATNSNGDVSKLVQMVSNGQALHEALYELFTGSQSIQQMQRKYEPHADTDADDLQLSLFEADANAQPNVTHMASPSLAQKVDAIIDQIGTLPIGRIEAIREELMDNILDVLYDHGIDDGDGIISNILFEGHDEGLTSQSGKARFRNTNKVIQTQAGKLSNRFEIKSVDPLTIVSDGVADTKHEFTVGSPENLSTMELPYAIVGRTSMDANEALLKVVGLQPFSFRNPEGELIQDLGESPELTEFRNILNDQQHELTTEDIKNNNYKYVDAYNTNALHNAGFDTSMSGDAIASQVSANINGIIDARLKKAQEAGKQLSEEEQAELKLKYEALYGKRLSTAASYMKDLDESGHALTKALATKYGRSAHAIFANFFDKSSLIVNNATTNQSAIDAAEINNQKYEDIATFAQRVGLETDMWNSNLQSLGTINYRLFNASSSGNLGSIAAIRKFSTVLVNKAKRSGAHNTAEAIKWLEEKAVISGDDAVKLTSALNGTANTLNSMYTSLNGKYDKLQSEQPNQKIDVPPVLDEIQDVITQITDVTGATFKDGKLVSASITPTYSKNSLSFILSLGGLTDGGASLYASIKGYLNDFSSNIAIDCGLPAGIIKAVDAYYDTLSHIMSDTTTDGLLISKIISDAYNITGGSKLTGGIVVNVPRMAKMFATGTKIVSGEIYSLAGSTNVEVPPDVLEPETDYDAGLPEEVDPELNDDETRDPDTVAAEQDFTHNYSDEFNSSDEESTSEGIIVLRRIASADYGESINAAGIIKDALAYYDESQNYMNKFADEKRANIQMMATTEGVMYRVIDIVMQDLLGYVLKTPRTTTCAEGARRLSDVRDSVAKVADLYKNGRMNSPFVASRMDYLLHKFDMASSVLSTISNHHYDLPDGAIKTRESLSTICDNYGNPTTDVVAKCIIAILQGVNVLGQSVEVSDTERDNRLLNALDDTNAIPDGNKYVKFDEGSENYKGTATFGDVDTSSANPKDPVSRDALSDSFARAIISPKPSELVGKSKTVDYDVQQYFNGLSTGMDALMDNDAKLRHYAAELADMFGRNEYTGNSSANRNDSYSSTDVDFSTPVDLVNGQYMAGVKKTDRMGNKQDENYKTGASSRNSSKVKTGGGIISSLYKNYTSDPVYMTLVNDIFDDERAYGMMSYPTVTDTLNKLLSGADVKTYRKNVSPTVTEYGVDGKRRHMYNSKGSLVSIYPSGADGQVHPVKYTEDEICEKCGINEMPLIDERTNTVPQSAGKLFAEAVRRHLVTQMINDACDNWGNASNSRLANLIKTHSGDGTMYSSMDKFSNTVKHYLLDGTASKKMKLADIIVCLNPAVMDFALDANARAEYSHATNGTSSSVDDTKVAEVLHPNTVHIINGNEHDNGDTTPHIADAVSRDVAAYLRDDYEAMRAKGYVAKSIITKVSTYESEFSGDTRKENAYVSSIPNSYDRQLAADVFELARHLCKSYHYSPDDIREKNIIASALSGKVQKLSHANTKLGLREQSVGVAENILQEEGLHDFFAYLFKHQPNPIADQISNNSYQLLRRDGADAGTPISARELYTDVKKVHDLQKSDTPDAYTEILFRDAANIDSSSDTAFDKVIVKLFKTGSMYKDGEKYHIDGANTSLPINGMSNRIISAMKTVLGNSDIAPTAINNKAFNQIVSVLRTTTSWNRTPNQVYRTDNDTDKLEKTEVVNGKEVCAVCHGTGKVNGEVCPQCKGMPEKVRFQKSNGSDRIDIVPETSPVRPEPKHPSPAKRNFRLEPPVIGRYGVDEPADENQEQALNESIDPDFWEHW